MKSFKRILSPGFAICCMLLSMMAFEGKCALPDTSQQIIVIEPDSLTATGDANALSCPGSNDGTIDVLPAGGAPPYTFSWTGPSGFTSSDQNLSNLEPGQYFMDCTDTGGCQLVSLTFDVMEPDALSDSGSAVTNVLCAGDSSGSIDLAVSGGKSPYTFSWSDGSSQQSPQNLPAGTFTVTITDGNGCTFSNAFSISEPAPVVVTLFAQSNVTCSGGTDGWASVTVSGGEAPYSYFWSDPFAQTNALASNLPAGVMTCLVFDNKGCLGFVDITITEPDQLSDSVAVNNQVTCSGGNDGSATVILSGGTAPYSFAWSDGETSQTNSALSAGGHSVSVSDANGCSSNGLEIEITEPDMLVLAFTGVTDPACTGSSDGSVSASISGGIPPYNYGWSAGGSGESASNLSAGTYSLTVTDSSGCTISANVTLTDPPVLFASASQVAGVSCFTWENGVASISVSGGNPPYVYFWDNYEQGDTAYWLARGNHSVTVYDLSCSVTASVVIGGVDELVGTINVSQHVSCYGASDGSATVSVTGGQAPYSYYWSTEDSVSTTNNAPAGLLQSWIIDDNGCVDSTGAVINQPTVIEANASGTPSCLDSSGTAQVNPSGGNDPYSILWSNGATSNSLVDLVGGEYTVSITDSSGCVRMDTVIVEDTCACPQVQALWHDKVTTNSARLLWTGLPQADHYIIRGRVVGGSGWQVINIANGAPEFKDVFGLMNNTSYLWQIRTVCDVAETEMADWSVADTFSTGCFAPDTSFTSPVTSNSARLNWTKVSGSVGYEIRGRRSGAGTWTTILVGGANTTIKDVFGLIPATQYEWVVRAWCDTSGMPNSDWTGLNIFTTSPQTRWGTPGTVESFESGDEVYVKVRPNPSDGNFELHWRISGKTKAILSVYDVTGKLVSSSNIERESENINLSQLAAGIYHLELESDGEVVIGRLMLE